MRQNTLFRRFAPYESRLPCQRRRKATVANACTMCGHFASTPAAPFRVVKMQGVHALLVFPRRFKTIALSLIFTPRTAYAVSFALSAGRFCVVATRFCPSRKSKILARGPRSHFCNAVRSLRSSLSSHSLQISSSRTACAVYCSVATLYHILCHEVRCDVRLINSRAVLR